MKVLACSCAAFLAWHGSSSTVLCSRSQVLPPNSWDVLRLQLSSGDRDHARNLVTLPSRVLEGEKEGQELQDTLCTTSLQQVEGRHLDSLQEMDIESYRNLINAFQNKGDARSALRLYRKSRQQFLGINSTGIPRQTSRLDEEPEDKEIVRQPDERTVKTLEELSVIVLDLCVESLSRGLEGDENRFVLYNLFQKMQYARLPLSKFACRRLLLLCSSKSNDHVVLRAVYNFMSERRMLTTTLCNHSIRVLGIHRKWWAALEIYETMPAAGCKPNNLTFKLLRSQLAFLVAAAKRKNSWKWCLQLMDKMEDKNVRPGKEAWDLALVTCARAGRSRDTLELFQRMIRWGYKPDVHAFGALLSSFEKEDNVPIRDMELVLASMHKSNVRATESIYTTLISALGKAGSFEAIPKMVEEMEAAGIQLSVVTYNAIITAFARVGDAESAVFWMKRLEAAKVEPNTITYNKLVEALAAGNRWRDAVATYVFMIDSNREPSPWAYDAVARACSANNVEIDHRWIGRRPRQVIQSR